MHRARKKTNKVLICTSQNCSVTPVIKGQISTQACNQQFVFLWGFQQCPNRTHQLTWRHPWCTWHRRQTWLCHWGNVPLLWLNLLGLKWSWSCRFIIFIFIRIILLFLFLALCRQYNAYGQTEHKLYSIKLTNSKIQTLPVFKKSQKYKERMLWAHLQPQIKGRNMTHCHYPEHREGSALLSVSCCPA